MPQPPNHLPENLAAHFETRPVLNRLPVVYNPAFTTRGAKNVNFDGQVILVTGAAGSIGTGLARRFCETGGRVFITDLDQAVLDGIAKELAGLPGKCRGLAADVTDHGQVKRVVAAALEAFGGRIDVLVNVAGTVGQGNKVEDISPENWDFVFAVNCKGTFLFCKEVVPVMKKAGRGNVINFSSKSGKTGSALMSHYSAAKAAIIGFTQALAFELAPKIRVNCVCPGITENTGVWSNVSKDYVENLHLPIDEVVKKFTSKVPLGRLAHVEDVVAVTTFLASDDAAYMTGQAINITGGREMH
jgi:NAD(P)-dependent dehydrogenase (short-subunit alcohol dehydrogenase family)